MALVPAAAGLAVLLLPIVFVRGDATVLTGESAIVNIRMPVGGMARFTAGGNTWTQGDLNYDGEVSSDDYALFALGPAYQNRSLAIVPEPAAAGIRLTGGIRCAGIGTRWNRTQAGTKQPGEASAAAKGASGKGAE